MTNVIPNTRWMEKSVDLSRIHTVANIIASICDWNAARYGQVFNADLTHNLLIEELNETLAAMNTHLESDQDEHYVEILDGLADTFFVAVGALWKLGHSHTEIGVIIDSVELDTVVVPPFVISTLWASKACNAYTLSLVVLSALEELTLRLRGSNQAALDVVRAICDSNNTKAVPNNKVDPAIKANTTKGTFYVPPTEDLYSILAGVNMGGYVNE